MTKYGSNFINLFIVGETRRFLEFETQLQKQIDMPYSKVACTMEKLLQRFLKKVYAIKRRILCHHFYHVQIKGAPNYRSFMELCHRSR